MVCLVLEKKRKEKRKEEEWACLLTLLLLTLIAPTARSHTTRRASVFNAFCVLLVQQACSCHSKKDFSKLSI